SLRAEKELLQAQHDELRAEQARLAEHETSLGSQQQAMAEARLALEQQMAALEAEHRSRESDFERRASEAEAAAQQIVEQQPQHEEEVAQAIEVDPCAEAEHDESIDDHETPVVDEAPPAPEPPKHSSGLSTAALLAKYGVKLDDDDTAETTAEVESPVAPPAA